MEEAVFGFEPTVLDGLPDKLSDDVEPILFEGLFEVPERARS